MILLLVSFAGGFLLASLVVLLLTGNPDRAAIIGVVCGFAVAFVLDFIIMGRQTGGHEGDG